jgi:bloom syndrome protein
VTLVISPLLSLIQDQIQHLQARGISAAWLSGTMDAQQRAWVFSELQRPAPTLRLVYMTPEMINKSKQAQEAIRQLYNRNQLARFVIDEAHCLSQYEPPNRIKL